jgi:hypothetical protein
MLRLPTQKQPLASMRAVRLWKSVLSVVVLLALFVSLYRPLGLLEQPIQPVRLCSGTLPSP